ncbi:MAG: helix-turn-helix transcriptional regulator [Bacteriovoracaceae bacterium]|nr:helix-turn-helix transcriptional regulator [Bacteriovoracaceae bacterium]
MIKIYYSTLLKNYVSSELSEEKRDALSPVFSSILNQYLDYQGLSQSSPVGEELYDVEKLGLYFESLEDRYSKATIPGIRSKLKKIREFAIKLSYNHDIIKLQFGEALNHILKVKKVSGRKLAESLEVRPQTVTDWISGKFLPSYKHVGLVDKIEAIFEVPKGVLKSKLGKVTHGEKVKLFDARERTVHGQKNQELSQKGYKLPYNKFPQKVQDDLDTMVAFFTSDFPQVIHPNFKRAKKQRWKIKAHKNESGKAKIVLKDVEQFFGFLVAPTDHKDPMQQGLGLPVEKLSLSLMMNIEFISKYVQFRMMRKDRLTTGIKRILDQLKAFCRKRYGYIRQHTKLGQEYFTIQNGKYVYPYGGCNSEEWNDLWDKICESTFEYLEDTIESSNFTSDVDTFKPIENIVDTDILSQIKDITGWIRHDASLKGVGAVKTAIKKRDSLLTLLIFLFELRIDHYAIMEFDKHLFERDGKFLFRIFREELKRPEILKSPYVTLTIPDDVAAEIIEYRDVHRRHLYGADTSKKVFLGSPTGRKTADSINGLQARSLSFAFKTLMTLYSSSTTGFGPHAVRKIITSVLDRKRDLADFDQAAQLAMHTPTVSRESYAAHQVESAFNHYVSRLQRAGVLEMPKGERRKIEVDEIEYNDLVLRNKELEQMLIEAQEKLKGISDYDDIKLVG